MKKYKSYDCTVFNDETLECIFCNVAGNAAETIYPGIEIPKYSITVGNIYKNKQSMSCQVKLPANNIIVMVKYFCDKKKFECKCYKMNASIEIIYADVLDESEEEHPHSYIVMNPKYEPNGGN